MDLNIYNCQQFKVDLEEYHKLNDVSKISSLRTVVKDFESSGADMVNLIK